MIDAREEYVAAVGSPELLDGLSAMAMAADLLRSVRGAGAHVIHVRHVPGGHGGPPLRPGTTAIAIRPEVEPLPGEPVIATRAAGAFAGTPLYRELADRDVETVIIAGLMSADSCSATACEAIERRLRTVLSSDATAARSGEPGEPSGVRDSALAVQRRRGAEVLSCESIATLLGAATA
ncbi:MAG: cysteine hydrolase [Thermoleophilia bacterium]|nr:cysteine hydrolase [Thermoleophilia bacterium]